MSEEIKSQASAPSLESIEDIPIAEVIPTSQELTTNNQVDNAIETLLNVHPVIRIMIGLVLVASGTYSLQN